jgi:Right handed beta helix region
MRPFGRRTVLFILLAPPTLLGMLQVVGAYNRWSYARRAAGHVQPHPPRVLYVAANGSDDADGLTPATAWRTLGRVSREALVPGDSVRLQGGAVFPGTLVLDEDDVGSAGRPITITSIGDGPATLAAGAGNGVVISETDGVHVTNLRILGTSHAALDTSRLASESRAEAARTVATLPSGILVRNALHGDVQLRGIRISSVDVSGFSGHGILIDGARWFSGFRDVVIEDARVHHNGLSGIYVQGEYPHLIALLAGRITPRYAHSGVVIRRVTAHDNTGVPGPWRQNTGSGIVVSGVRGALIEASEAYANGAWCNSLQGGPVGIWAWDADSVTIQQNRSHHNRAGGRKDGGGFDFDGGTTNSVVQQNASWENDGAGYLLYQFQYAQPYRNNVVRDNTSRDDGRRNRFGGVHLLGALHDIRVEGNTIETSPAHDDATPRAIMVEANPDEVFSPATVTRNVSIMHNTITLHGTVTAIHVDSGHGGLRFDSNTYVADSAVRIIWSGRTYVSVAAWRQATGQERSLRIESAASPVPAPVPSRVRATSSAARKAGAWESTVTR